MRNGTGYTLKLSDYIGTRSYCCPICLTRREYVQGKSRYLDIQTLCCSKTCATIYFGSIVRSLNDRSIRIDRQYYRDADDFYKTVKRGKKDAHKEFIVALVNSVST